ncbi:MAG: hypothetical protein JKY30_15215 [Flavobacteriales bacterium]|nr:hypothetical protein [Flavobacteriales bacterium]
MEDGNRKHWVYRFAQIRPGELAMVLRCGACFFFLLFGYFLLRPLREAMGVERSMRDLRWLFVVTCIVSLGFTLGFGGLVSKLKGRRFIPIAFRSVMACLVVFIVLMQLPIGDDARLYVGYVFYVWLSVINLLMMSIFWAMMADVWSLGQGKRLFAAVGVGGTLGALLGSNFVWWLAESISPAIQMGIAIVMFECVVRIVRQIDRAVVRTRDQSLEQVQSMNDVGGQWADGAKAIAGSPYLLGIGLYIMLLAVSNTLIYFTQANLVSDASDELNTRIALFAQLDMWTQLATLFVQLFATAHLIKRLGIGVTLAILPIVTVVGFAAMAWVQSRPGVEPWQIFGVFAAFSAIHRATRYAVIRPARGTLFSVVPTAIKFKAKPIVDVFMYRGGDVLGVRVEALIAGAGLGMAGMAMTAVPLAVFWGGLSIALAVAQQRKSHPNEYGIEEQGTYTGREASMKQEN